MDPKKKRLLQIGLVIVALGIIGLRFYFLQKERSDTSYLDKRIAEKKGATLTADQYVNPRKLRAYDLKTARELVGMPAWFKNGYGVYYYRYNPKTKRSDWSQPAGLMEPLQKLDVKDVVVDAPPAGKKAAPKKQTFTDPSGTAFTVTMPEPPQEKQVMVVFEKDGQQFAFPAGVVQGDNYSIYIDDMVFIQDPKKLYDHWSADIWQSVDKHELKKGMSELQASFAAGIAYPQDTGDQGDKSSKVMVYPRDNRPLRVTYDSKGVITNIEELQSKTS